MDRGAVENLRGVEIADPRHGFLVEERHLDGSTAHPQAFAEDLRRTLERVGPEPLGSVERVEFVGPVETHVAQSPPIPVQHGRNRPGKPQPEAKMLLVRWIAHQDETRHAWLKDERIAAFDLQGHAFAESTSPGDPLTGESSLESRPAGPNRQRFELTPRTLDRLDHRANNTSDATTHRLDFGQFGHGRHPAG